MAQLARWNLNLRYNARREPEGSKLGDKVFNLSLTSLTNGLSLIFYAIANCVKKCGKTIVIYKSMKIPKNLDAFTSSQCFLPSSHTRLFLRLATLNLLPIIPLSKDLIQLIRHARSVSILVRRVSIDL